MEQEEVVSLKEYLNQRFTEIYKYLEVNFELDRKAVEKYSQTNDEWKALHNGLQRKMEEERGKYVEQERFDQLLQTVRDKINTGVHTLDEKITLAKVSGDDKRDAIMKNLEDKFYANLKSATEKMESMDKQMKILVDGNAEVSNRAIAELTAFKSSSQGSMRVVLAVGGFLMAIVLALVVAFIRDHL